MFRTLFHLMCLALAMATVLLITACGSPSPEPTPCASPKEAFYYHAPVIYEDGTDETILLILVCGEDRTVTIIDHKGNTYASLEDFQENNDFLTAEDQLFLPDDFPSVEQTEPELMEVPGHTEEPPIGWMIAGGAAALLLIAVVARWLFNPWKTRRD
jgi:hypothetical protein